MKVIDKINGSALFAQSAFSASTATKDSLGRDITATYLTGVNLPESASWNETSNVVSSNSAKWSEGKTYEGVSPIVVNNDESKISADTWTLSAGDGVSFTEDSANKVTRIDVTAQGGNYIPYTATDNVLNAFETNSGLEFKTNIDGELQSNFINKGLIILSYVRSPLGVYDKATLNTGSLTFENKYNSAYVDIEKIHTWDSASNYIQTISSTYYPKSNPSSFVTESWVNYQGYLTAHQDISNKLDSSAFSSVSGDFLTTSFSIPESAVWNETSNVVQTNSAQWGQGGGSVSSKYGTISVDGSNIEATNKAIEIKVNGFTSSFDAIVLDEHQPSTATFTWDNYSEGTTLTFSVLNHGNSDNLTYSSNTNVTGVITAAQWTPTNVSLSIPNATEIQFSADHGYDLQNIQVSASSSIQVKELAWKTDLPTYSYNSSNKLSAINGSALVGNEDYLVEQGFVQNLTSPKGTISVLNNNKIEGTNSAIASDVIEGFVSAYNGLSVYPGNSATLSWANYVPNTFLHVSGAQWSPTTLTYSADTGVTGQISLPNEGETSIEVPTNSTSIVIGNENWSNTSYNCTVSAADYYEIGQLAWASALPTYEYDSTNKISAINGSAIAGGGDVPVSANEAIQYVQTNSAVIDATITNVTSNSGVWGGSALPISAGPGIGLNLDNNVLIISSNGAGGGFYSTSALLYQGSKNDQRTTAWNLTESISSYKMIQCDWIDTNNYFVSKQISIPSGLGNDMTRAAFFDAIFEYGSDLWCKAQRFSAQNNTVYAQVDEYCVHTNGTVSNVGSDIKNNRPIMVQIIGVK